MIRGGFSWHCLGSLVHVPTSLNEIRYVELLGDHLHPFMLFYYPHGNGVFNRDKCASHNSQLATGPLDERSSDVSAINWPDLNTVKYPWDIFLSRRERPSQHQRTLLNYGQLWPIFGKSFP
ncbi:transposable element Tcb2 transposase [Trichonephila clavipes]|nr:transposable element Tcb2 transposase [Trichonephila clavipes]